MNSNLAMNGNVAKGYDGNVGTSICSFGTETRVFGVSLTMQKISSASL